MAGVNHDVCRLVDAVARRFCRLEEMSEADWQRLAAVAVRHDLAPVLHARLKEGGIVPPTGVAEELRGYYLGSAARNMRLFHELGQILVALQRARLPVIPLKGACLAELVYRDIALRPMADLDLLVKSGDVAKAVAILRRSGYAPEAGFDAAAEQALNHGVPMSKADGTRVDLHWSILPPRCHTDFAGDDLEGCWSRAESATIGGVAVLVMSPTDLLLHLSVHASVFHRFDDIRLRNFVDVAQVCARYGEFVDFERLTDRANKWGVANGVRIVLALAAEWTDVSMPPNVVAALNGDPVGEEVLDWVRYKVLNGSSRVLQSEAIGLVGRARPGDQMRVLRDAWSPFRVVLTNLHRTPALSLRSLRDYFVRLIQFSGRELQVLWLISRQDRSFAVDVRRERRLREYLGCS